LVRFILLIVYGSVINFLPVHTQPFFVVVNDTHFRLAPVNNTTAVMASVFVPVPVFEELEYKTILLMAQSELKK